MAYSDVAGSHLYLHQLARPHEDLGGSAVDFRPRLDLLSFLDTILLIDAYRIDSHETKVEKCARLGPRSHPNYRASPARLLEK
jgi:hypothetical protein